MIPVTIHFRPEDGPEQEFDGEIGDAVTLEAMQAVIAKGGGSAVLCIPTRLKRGAPLTMQVYRANRTKLSLR